MAAEHSSAASALVTADEPTQPRRPADVPGRSRTPTPRSPPPCWPAPSRPSAPLQRYQADIARPPGRPGSAAGGRRPAGPTPAWRAERRTRGLRGRRRRGPHPSTRSATRSPAARSSRSPRRRRTRSCCPPRTPSSTRENAARSAASSQATGLPLIVAALVLAIVAGYVLYRAQRWLTRRTNRVFSPGLVLASVLLVVSVIWLAAGFLGRPLRPRRRHRPRLSTRAEPRPRQHRRPADQGRRGPQRHLPQRQRLLRRRLRGRQRASRAGPGQLAQQRRQRASQDGGPGAAAVAAAEREATAWYAGQPGTVRSSATRPTTPPSSSWWWAAGRQQRGRLQRPGKDLSQAHQRRPGRLPVRPPARGPTCSTRWPAW